MAQRAGEFGFGLRGIDQIFKFAESSGQAVNPSEFGSYETAKGTIEKQLKLDLEKDVFEQLSGDITRQRVAQRVVAGAQGRGQGPGRVQEDAGCR